MTTFGLVTEGGTDQVVISNILYGYYRNKNIPINHLQPLYDETDNSRQLTHGGWGHVMAYIESEQFRQSFQFNDYLIIQIDTDVCEQYGISKYEETGKLSTANELVEKVKQHLISKIGGFYQNVSSRIIFGISVHFIECWILPLYFADGKKEKITGCLGTLNRELSRRYGFSIDPDNKIYDYYVKIAKPFMNHRKIDTIKSHNPSLKIFCKELKSKNITI